MKSGAWTLLRYAALAAVPAIVTTSDSLAIPTVPPGYQIEQVVGGLDDVRDIYRDSFGRLLVVERGSGGPGSDGVIRSVGPQGTLTMISSGYINPLAVVVDLSGTLFVADVGPTSITGDTDGLIWKDEGAGPVSLSTPFTSPVDAIFDPADPGSILVAELSGLPPLLLLADAGIIAVNSSSGSQSVFFDDDTGPTSTNLTNLTSIAIGPHGSIFAADNADGLADGNANVYRIVSGTTKTALLPRPTPLTNPGRIRLSPDGRLFISDDALDTIFVVGPGSSTAVPFITTIAAPWALLAEDDAIYFSESGTTIWKVFKCEQLPPGAVAWWTGDGHADDIVGGNGGTLQNGATFALGQVGDAFSLDGIDDHVLILDDPSLNFGTGDFSVSAWVKTSFVGGTMDDFVLSKGSIGSDFQYLLQYRAAPDREQAASFGMGDGSVSGVFVATLSPFSIADGQFHHLVGVRHGTTLELHVDGQLVDTVTTPSLFPATSTNNVVIGGRQDPGFDPYFNGLIDEVQLFDRALSPCEIKDLFEGRSGGQCKGDTDGDTVLDFEDNCPLTLNTGQANTDGDLAGDDCDCAPTDPGAFSIPTAEEDLELSADGGGLSLSLCSAEFSAGSGTVYDVLRGALGEFPVGTGPSEICLGAGLASPEIIDSTTPLEDDGFWYLIRKRNSCGDSTWGFESDGDERISATCGPPPP
jgi:hypothetical protein